MYTVINSGLCTDTIPQLPRIQRLALRGTIALRHRSVGTAAYKPGVQLPTHDISLAWGAAAVHKLRIPLALERKSPLQLLPQA